jgi:hypothetical protein
MAAASDIIINDGQSTPVAHTFTPFSKDGSMVVWLERTTAHTSAGFYPLTVSQSSPNGKSPVVRTKITLALPLEAYNSSTGIYSYTDTSRVILDVLMPVSMVAAGRADVYAYLKNLMAHATIEATIKDLSPPY